MSRIGNRLLTVPTNVTFQLQNNLIVLSNDSNQIAIKYNKHLVDVVVTDNVVTTKPRTSAKESRMQQGTINALIKNGFEGLTTGFSKTLKIVGVGYKAAVNGSQLTLTLGYSHPIELKIPSEVQLELVSPTEIKLTSFNREILGEFAANIRKWRKPEPYKGKGIAYSNEYILRKVGKTSDGGKGKK